MFQSLFAICCFVTAVCQAANLSIAQPFGELIDQKVIIKVDGAMPQQIIELKAKAVDGNGEMWTSRAFFQADGMGSVDVSAQRPMEDSSYEEADGMGLFWSMRPQLDDPLYNFLCAKDRFTVEIGLYQDGEMVEKEIVTRFLSKPEVVRTEIRENGVVGVLFAPPSEKPLPVIVTFTGSNGGVNEMRSKLIASHGFAVLALGYFAMEGLPDNLEDIPFEYFENAFAWIRSQKNIDGSRIGLYGGSRGGELVLLLGWQFPELVKAIVSVVPTSVVNGGLSDTPVNAWTYGGKPLYPYMRVPPRVYQESSKDNPTIARRLFLDDREEFPKEYEAAFIPVEKIRCPMLLISGGDDQIWPSDVYSEEIMERLKKCNSTADCRHLNYPLAGHSIGIPNLPVYGPIFYHSVMERWYTMGGSRPAGQQANADSWDELVSFFEKQL